jgi:mannose-6-phosphate isomerase-like protein (cupin superfamily)
MILRAGERFRSAQDGIESWHCFSAGAHYDPDNVAFGALIGADEHLLAPGAGFDWHPHRGVVIVSWVVSGTLRHEDDGGEVLQVQPGDVLVQHAGSGIRHRESNGSDERPLRLVQMTLTGDEGSGVQLTAAPVQVGASRFTTWQSDGGWSAPRWHAHAVEGTWTVGPDRLAPGDSARGTGPVTTVGAGLLLVWELT